MTERPGPGVQHLRKASLRSSLCWNALACACVPRVYVQCTVLEPRV